MKLNRVEIKNFKSIKDITVSFEPACRVLVGINESGKSNILNALAFLGEDYEPVNKDDLREALPDEDPITESTVRFVFRFEKEESDELFEIISAKIVTDIKNPEIVSMTKPLTLKEFCDTLNEGLYTADILKETKFFSYCTIDNKYKLLAGWKKLTGACPADFSVELKGQN